MHRNLDRRVEALVQVTDPAARAELATVFRVALAEEADAFELRADGSWSRRRPASPVHLHEALLRRAVGRVA